jgi:hypothetical protein
MRDGESPGSAARPVNKKMFKLTGKQKLQTAVLVLFLSIAAYASVKGPDPGYTDAPGDLGNCTACHDHNLLNSGPGSVGVKGLPSVYQPGQSYNFTVTTAQAGRIRFGFQLTAIDTRFSRAGTLASVDGTTQVLPQTGLGGRQYIEHKEEGTLSSVPGGLTWHLKWTAPDTDIGTVRFYVAGNATDNSGKQDDNDFIYTNSASSDSATSFVSVSLQSQPGGLSLQAGSHFTIGWNVSGVSNIDNVELRYSTDDGMTFPISNLILFTTNPEITIYDWTVPNTPTTNAVIRVQVGKKSGDAVQTLSGVFTITGDGTATLPKITSASVSGKKLFVVGESFQMGAVVELNGDEQATLNDDDFSHLLRCKKAGKKIASGSTVTLTVRNPDGTVSEPFSFTRPLE